MFDREDHKQLIAEKNGQRVAFMRPQIELVLQAAVKAENLTGDPLWDTFLSFVQGAIEKTMKQRDNFKVMLSAPELVDQNEMLRVKIRLLQCEERITAWEAISALPGDLKKMGDEAKQLLERMPVLDS